MQEQEFSMSLKDLALIVWGRKWFVLISAIGIMLLSLFISKFFITPMYQATTTVIVATGSTSTITVNDLSASNKLATSYSQLIKSDSIMRIVIDRLNLNMSSGELKKDVTTVVTQNSDLLTIKVNDENPKTAMDIANEIVSVFQEQVPKLYANTGNSGTIIPADVATLPSFPSSPKILQNCIIGFAVGLLLSIFLLFIKELTRNTFVLPGDVEKHLDLPVIGIIPETPETGGVK